MPLGFAKLHTYDYDMKRILFCIFLLASLTACSGASSQSTHECNKKEGVCVKIKVEEPIVAGEPAIVTITVKGDKDISDLQVGLSATGNVLLEEPDLKTWKKTGIGWKVDLKANKEHSSKRKLLLPVEEGFYHVVVSVGTPNYGEMVSYSVRISVSNKQAKVYYPGTKIPDSDNSVIMPVYTLSPGPFSTQTATPTLETVTPSYP